VILLTASRISAAFFGAFTGHWIKAEAATVLASLLAFGSFKIFPAFEAIPLLVTTLDVVSARADAATCFSLLLAVLLVNTIDAADAVVFTVGAVFAIVVPLNCRQSPEAVDL